MARQLSFYDFRVAPGGVFQFILSLSRHAISFLLNVLRTSKPSVCRWLSMIGYRSEVATLILSASRCFIDKNSDAITNHGAPPCTVLYDCYHSPDICRGHCTHIPLPLLHFKSPLSYSGELDERLGEAWLTKMNVR